ARRPPRVGSRPARRPAIPSRRDRWFPRCARPRRDCRAKRAVVLNATDPREKGTRAGRTPGGMETGPVSAAMVADFRPSREMFDISRESPFSGGNLARSAFRTRPTRLEKTELIGLRALLRLGLGGGAFARAIRARGIGCLERLRRRLLGRAQREQC